MAVFHVVIEPILSAIISLLTVYKWILIIAIVMSWIRPDPYNPIVKFIISITEPVFARIRQLIPLRIGMIDLSPIILFILIQIIQRMLRYFIYNIRF
ncbi:MAG: YggT family protein [Spirochaetes bacterium]|nr:YggT family protein [Spirochaetota bacterium]